jgi:hypothetical protein
MQPRDNRPKLDTTQPIQIESEIVCIQIESEIVCIEPGMGDGFVQLTAYRADGRPFLRFDMPEEAVKAWAPLMERYTEKHDATRVPRLLKLEP